MATWKAIMVAVVLFVVVVAFAFGAFEIADASQNEAAANANTVENETLVQQVGVYQLVDKSTKKYTARFNSTVTVYNNSSVKLNESTDYEWNESDGAILFKDTASTNDGEPANITYEYYENTGSVKDISGPVGVIVDVVGQLPRMVAGLAFAVMFFAFAAILLRSTDNLGGGPRTRR